MRVFHFSDSESFKQDTSKEFSSLLRSSPDIVQEKVFTSYGLKAEFDGRSFRTTYDGMKIGIGSFASNIGEIHFVINPKIDTFKVQDIFTAIGVNRFIERCVIFENLPTFSTFEDAESNFSPSVLLWLLDEIIRCSATLLSSSNRRKEIYLINGISGRPNLQKSLRNIALGKGPGFYCEVLDEQSLRDYAIVLLETARSIGELLEDWYSLIPSERKEYSSKLRFLSSKFGIYESSSVFSHVLLLKTCRPPFPFGLKDILYKCLRYWQWRGAFSISEMGLESFGYWGVSIHLDRVFQEYVGLTWSSSINEMGVNWFPSPKFKYKIVSDYSETIGEGDQVPDHLFFHESSRTLFIVDAKYKIGVGQSPDVHQMVAYCDYKYTDLEPDKVVGILVYPGKEWEEKRIVGFHKSIYFIKIPIQKALYNPSIHEFTRRLINEQVVIA